MAPFWTWFSGVFLMELTLESVFFSDLGGISDNSLIGTIRIFEILSIL